MLKKKYFRTPDFGTRMVEAMPLGDSTNIYFCR